MDDLTGTLVLVRHQLAYDPAEKQGKIGVITAADLEHDDIFVSFGKGEPVVYASNTLMVLKNPNELYRQLITGFKEMEKEDFKTLFQINLLQQHGSAQQIRTAMEIASGSQVIINYSMMALEEKLARERSASREVEASQVKIRSR